MVPCESTEYSSTTFNTLVPECLISHAKMYLPVSPSDMFDYNNLSNVNYQTLESELFYTLQDKLNC